MYVGSFSLYLEVQSKLLSPEELQSNALLPDVGALALPKPLSLQQKAAPKACSPKP